MNDKLQAALNSAPDLIELPDGNMIDPRNVRGIRVIDAPRSSILMPRIVIDLWDGRCLIIECSDYEGARTLAKRLGAQINETRSKFREIMEFALSMQSST